MPSFYLLLHASSFKDQIEGARLLSLLAQTNSWPAAIFTELKYELEPSLVHCRTCLFRSADHRTLTFHVLDNAYQINASNVASAASECLPRSDVSPHIPSVLGAKKFEQKRLRLQGCSFGMRDPLTSRTAIPFADDSNPSAFSASRARRFSDASMCLSWFVSKIDLLNFITLCYFCCHRLSRSIRSTHHAFLLVSLSHCQT